MAGVKTDSRGDVKLDAEQYEAIKKLAALRYRTIAAEVRLAIREYLEREAAK